jgi:hypothetical protein
MKRRNGKKEERTWVEMRELELPLIWSEGDEAKDEATDDGDEANDAKREANDIKWSQEWSQRWGQWPRRKTMMPGMISMVSKMKPKDEANARNEPKKMKPLMPGTRPMMPGMKPVTS